MSSSLRDRDQLVDDVVGLLVEARASTQLAAVGLQRAGVLARVLAATARRPCSGDHGVTPRPSSSAIGMSSPSTVRSSSEYSICSATSGAQPRKLRDRLRLRDLPRRRVGEADVADLARRARDRRARASSPRSACAVPGVHPVEIDVVGLQAAQRLLARRDDRLAAGAAAVGIAGDTGCRRTWWR